MKTIGNVKFNSVDETLEFGGIPHQPEIGKGIRILSQMKNVVYDTAWYNNAIKKADSTIYYMFRNMYLNDTDAKVAKDLNIRYDITVLPALKLGNEFTKTVGHYHPLTPGTNLSFTEIYQVLEGEAQYFLQKEENGKLIDAGLVHAQAGDMLIIPPHYGHITINALDKTLIMANWVGIFDALYGSIDSNKGGAYYFVDPTDQNALKLVSENKAEIIDGRMIAVPNTNYGILVPLRQLRATSAQDIYEYIKTPDKLSFLRNPEKFTDGTFFDF